MLSTLIPASPSLLSFGRIVIVAHKFIKYTFVTQFRLSINSCANSFGASYESEAFQSNCLKNDHALRVLLLTSYLIKLCWESRDNIFPDPDRSYVVALGGQTIFFPISLATHHPCKFLHPVGYRDFGATNPDRLWKARWRQLWGKILGGFPRLLDWRRFLRQRKKIAVPWSGLLGCLSWVSVQFSGKYLQKLLGINTMFPYPTNKVILYQTHPVIFH